MIKITEKQSVQLNFTHIRDGKPAALFIAMNPLTGDWLQEHKHGSAVTAYYGTKSAALSLANSIVKKSAANDLSCKVVIERRKVLP